jgi:hypothetical protein
MSCCVARVDGSTPGAAAVVELREFEIDWSAQGNRALTTGAENITTTDGDVLSVTSQVAAGDTNTLTSGSGLVWDEGTTNTSWDTGARTATSVLVPWSSIFTLLDTDATWRYKIESYYSALSLLNAEYIITGIDGLNASPANAGSRLSGCGRSRQAATQVWRPAIQATGVNYPTAPGGTVNVCGVTIDAQAISCHAGTWSGSWDSFRALIQWGIGKLQDAGLSAPMLDQNTRVVFSANASQGVVGTSSLTLERTRVQAIGFAV